MRLAGGAESAVQACRPSRFFFHNRTPAWLIPALFLVCLASVAGAQNTASGKLRLGDHDYALTNVFAIAEQDPLAGGDKTKLTILLTDQPVPADLRKAGNDWFYWAEKQARAGAAHGLIVTLHPETGAWDRGQLLTTDGFMFYTESVSGTESRFHFTPDGQIGEQVGGRPQMTEPMQTMDGKDWTVEAEFHSAVITLPAVTARLTGAAALSSAPYKAVAAFLAACGKGDVAGISAAVDPQSKDSLDAMLKQNRDEALKMFAGMAVGTQALKLRQVIVSQDSAVLEFVDPRKPDEVEQSLRAVLVDGAWKVAQ
jgi:hypothetical protein